MDRPQRIIELFNLFDHEERLVRGKAALAIARLAESHPYRLVRRLDRIREGLRDDSAYVRWTTAYAVGRIGACHPGKIAGCLPDLSAIVDDENPTVRSMACAALARIGIASPQLVLEHFESAKREIPPAVARSLRAARPGRPKSSQSR